MTSYPFIPLEFKRLPERDTLERARATYDEMSRRRATRHFSADPVPREAIEYAVKTAGTAPIGAHQQPWTFVAVSDVQLKQRIRAAAEAENTGATRNACSPSGSPVDEIAVWK